MSIACCQARTCASPAGRRRPQDISWNLRPAGPGRPPGRGGDSAGGFPPLPREGPRVGLRQLGHHGRVAAAMWSCSSRRWVSRPGRSTAQGPARSTPTRWATRSLARPCSGWAYASASPSRQVAEQVSTSSMGPTERLDRPARSTRGRWAGPGGRRDFARVSVLIRRWVAVPRQWPRPARPLPPQSSAGMPPAQFGVGLLVGLEGVQREQRGQLLLAGCRVHQSPSVIRRPASCACG